VLGEWLEARGYAIDTARLDGGDVAPDPAAYDLVVSLGSAEAADDDAVAWQATEQRTLRAADAAGTPVVGVCFGGQALSRALGGSVRRAARPELGWVSVGSAAPDLVADGPWMTWHKDEMLPPGGAEVLARNASGVQAWRLRGHVAVQFHPEADARIVDEWIALDREGANALGADPDALREQTLRHAAQARERAFALFDALLGGGA
jgi:GMP synthase (glutamine-hydrolysing)